MIIEAKFDKKKYTKLTFLAVFRNWSAILSFIAGLYQILTLTLMSASIPNPLFYFISLTGLFCLTTPFLIVYKGVKANFPSTLQEITINYELSDDQIKVSNESSKITTTNWLTFDKVKELENWFLIYLKKPTKITFFIVPKDSFGNNLSDFKKMIKDKQDIKLNLKK